jgi:hypothetical protein
MTIQSIREPFIQNAVCGLQAGKESEGMELLPKRAVLA